MSVQDNPTFHLSTHAAQQQDNNKERKNEKKKPDHRSMR
jgi:hypothetical protein